MRAGDRIDALRRRSSWSAAHLRPGWRCPKATLGLQRRPVALVAPVAVGPPGERAAPRHPGGEAAAAELRARSPAAARRRGGRAGARNVAPPAEYRANGLPGL